VATAPPAADRLPSATPAEVKRNATNAAAKNAVTTALKRREANVTAVSSAGEAIQAITRKRPDVLVSDIAMPDEDGYGLIKKIRSLETGASENIPAVAITAYAKEEDRERALSAGFQIYLAKPVELTELISVVARAARRDF